MEAGTLTFCFVIQPIDTANTKRFEDVFEPAIKEAGLDSAYRVDLDPGATVLIDEIEARIRESDAVLADISTDNPNVWFELGYALAAGKVVIMVCQVARDRFPFDIQHRHVIKYNLESPRDFVDLKNEIAARLKGQLERRAVMQDAVTRPVAAEQAGLDAQQLAALVTIAERLDMKEGLSAYQVRQKMLNVGFTDIAARIAIRGLERMGFVETFMDSDRSEEFPAFRVTEGGLAWLEQNQDKLALRYLAPAPSQATTRAGDDLSELPF